MPGLNSLGLGFIFTARDLASNKMRRLETRFKSLDERVTGGTDRMNAAFKQLGVGLAIFTAGAVTVGGAFALAGAAGKFEQGLASVGAVTQASTKQLVALKDAAIDAGIETQFSPTEAVLGLQSLATAGQTVEQSIRTLNPVLDLAAGSLGQLGVAQAAEAVVGTLNSYGKAADEAGEVTDKLLRITQLTNFQTRDFETGLAKAAASGAVFRQSLDDTLITMGLLRNLNIDASSSATAYREAVRRIGADKGAQKALGSQVEIFDQQTGQMRSIVDIMGNFERATQSMTEKQRQARAAMAFGARGMNAFKAVQGATFTTVRDGQQITLKGAEAIEALREKMAGAGGTAKKFREALLNTFEGQKTLLGGTLQTLAISLGEAFAVTFKPIVGAITNGLNLVLRFINAIPAPIKTLIGRLVLVFGGILTVVGAVVAAKAAVALFIIGMKALGITLGAVVAAAWPVVLAVAAVAVGIGLFVMAYRRNLGGAAEFTDRVLGQTMLGFKALGQLLSSGELSGAVMEELNRADNQGLKVFVIRMFQFATRLGAIWEGVKGGFVEAMRVLEPVWESLVFAVRRIGAIVAEVFGDTLGMAAGQGMDTFRLFGAALGVFIGGVTGLLVGLVTVGAHAVLWFAEQINSIRNAIGAAIDWIEQQVARVASVFSFLPGVTVPRPLPAAGGQSSVDAPMSIAAPAVAETRARASSFAGLESIVASIGKSFAAVSGGDVNINLVAEGETLARVSHNASRDDAIRSFSAEPSF